MEKFEFENLNLIDLQHLDIFCGFFEKSEDFKNELIKVMRFDIDDFESEDNYIRNNPQKKESICIGLEGDIHALLLNLFLRTDSIKLKDVIKKIIDDFGIDYLDEYLSKCILRKSEKDFEIINSLIELYFLNRENKSKLDNHDRDYVALINEYYQDYSARLNNQIDNIDEICNIKF
ncbi:MAG: hypothetical protein J6J17_02000 [Bacilli bacterium]|nr:hypothetical protein [Bacilli bacterium]